MSFKTYERAKLLAAKRFFNSVDAWFVSKGVTHEIRKFPSMKNIKIFYPPVLKEKVIETSEFFTKSSINFKIIR